MKDKEEDRMSAKKADPGSISTGTLKTTDLVRAFLDALNTLDPERAVSEETILRDDVYAAVMGEESVDEILVEKIDTLTDALQEYAPPGHYFGAHEGDGADFGFWPDPPEDPEDNDKDLEDLARDYEGYSRE